MSCNIIYKVMKEVFIMSNLAFKVYERNVKANQSKLRKTGQIPGIIYGEFLDHTIPIKMCNAELRRMLRKNNSGSIIEVELDDNFIFPSDELEEVEIEGLNNIEIAIMKLTEIYKEVFLLKYSHELENNEIAKLLNIKESTVRVRLARGKEKLEFILNKMEGVNNE